MLVGTNKRTVTDMGVTLHTVPCTCLGAERQVRGKHSILQRWVTHAALASLPLCGTNAQAHMFTAMLDVLQETA